MVRLLWPGLHRPFHPAVRMPPRCVDYSLTHFPLRRSTRRSVTTSCAGCESARGIAPNGSSSCCSTINVAVSATSVKLRTEMRRQPLSVAAPRMAQFERQATEVPHTRQGLRRRRNERGAQRQRCNAAPGNATTGVPPPARNPRCVHPTPALGDPVHVHNQRPPLM